MRIKVGKYEIDGKFKSEQDARNAFLAHFPAVTKSDLEKALKTKKFTDANKSDNTSKEDTDGDKQHAKAGKGSAGRKQSGEN